MQCYCQEGTQLQALKYKWCHLQVMEVVLSSTQCYSEFQGWCHRDWEFWNGAVITLKKKKYYDIQSECVTKIQCHYSLNVWQNMVWLQSECVTKYGECVTKYGVITGWMCDKIRCDYSLNVWQNVVWLQSECVTKYSVITVWMCDKIRCDYSLNVWQNRVWLQSECVTKYGVITVWMWQNMVWLQFECVTKYGVITVWMCDKNMVWCLTYLVIFSEKVLAVQWAQSTI